MKRRIYSAILRMHPPAFRRRFAAEMLWIFDESAGTCPLLIDGVRSLLRQWIARMGLWKIVAALFGAVLQIALGGGVWFLLNSGSKTISAAPIEQAEALQDLMRLIVWGAGATTVMVILASLWLRRFAARRSHAR